MIGSGGREHALVMALARDLGAEVHAAPGNPGMSSVAQLHDVDPMDGQAVAQLARASKLIWWSSDRRRRLLRGLLTRCAPRGLRSTDRVPKPPNLRDRRRSLRT